MSDLEEQISALRELVERQSEELSHLRSEVVALRSSPATAELHEADAEPINVMSRRRMLGTAGVAAAAGAVGLVASGLPAAAATGDNMIVGKINDAASPTALKLNTAHPSALQVFGSGDSFDANALPAMVLGYSVPSTSGPRSGVTQPIRTRARAGREVRRCRGHLPR
jgi:hypothetical protein